MELNQVTLPVTNMVEAVEFYLTLGFTTNCRYTALCQIYVS